MSHELAEGLVLTAFFLVAKDARIVRSLRRLDYEIILYAEQMQPDERYTCQDGFVTQASYDMKLETEVQEVDNAQYRILVFDGLAFRAGNSGDAYHDSLRSSLK